MTQSPPISSLEGCALHPQVALALRALRHHCLLLVHRDFGLAGPLPATVLAPLWEGVAPPGAPAAPPENHPDVWWAPLDRTTLRKEDVAPMAQLALFPPQQLRRRVFVLHRCHRMGPGAANSLLKTFEEPQIPVLFVLTAPSEESVLKTILSRCQTIGLRFVGPKSSPPPLEPQDMAWLQGALRALWGAPPPGPPSLSRMPITRGPFPVSLEVAAQMIPRLESLAKTYPAHVLRDALAATLAEGWKAWGHRVEFRVQARYVFEQLAQWSKADAWNGTPLLWLQSLLLRAAWGESPQEGLGAEPKGPPAQKGPRTPRKSG